MPPACIGLPCIGIRRGMVCAYVARWSAERLAVGPDKHGHRATMPPLKKDAGVRPATLV